MPYVHQDEWTQKASLGLCWRSGVRKTSSTNKSSKDAAISMTLRDGRKREGAGRSRSCFGDWSRYGFAARENRHATQRARFGSHDIADSGCRFSLMHSPRIVTRRALVLLFEFYDVFPYFALIVWLALSCSPSLPALSNPSSESYRLATSVSPLSRSLPP